MKQSCETAPLFRVLLKSNPKAHKILFYLTSYRYSWRVFALAIKNLQRKGYEVVVYDFNDYILDNNNPEVMKRAVKEVNADINQRIASYTAKGISTFDGVGSSLGAFLLYNYAVHYPLRKIVLNTGGYMSRVVYESTDRRIRKTKNNYERIGLDLQGLENEWVSIDAPVTGQNLKASETLFFTSLHDKHVTNEAAAELMRNMSLSKTKLTVHKNKRLGHNGAVLKNAHSKQLSYFLLND